MNKEELKALVAEILGQMEPAVKAEHIAPERKERKSQAFGDGDFVPDVTALDLRKLYLVEQPENGENYRKLKEKTPARLGCGKAGARYKTLTMLRFRADHAAAQDTVFTELDADFAKKHDLLPVKTRCDSKEEYLTRPDLGRCFDEHNAKTIQGVIDRPPRVQIVVGDGLSAEAIKANAMDCVKAMKAGLKERGISTGKDIFVKYCRVGAGDAVGDITGCELVCVLVGERPGLVTDKSMSAYITYKPHTGVSESSRTVVSNIHDSGMPAAKAGAYIAEVIERILEKRVSGVAFLKELRA